MNAGASDTARGSALRSRLRTLVHLQAWTGVGLGAALVGTWLPSMASTWSFQAAFVLLFVGLGVAWSLVYRRSLATSTALAECARSEQDSVVLAQETVGRYDEAIASIGPLVPVWRHSIEGGRVRMEAAVADLAERFDCLNEALSVALNDSDDAGVRARQTALREVTESARGAFTELWQSLEDSEQRDEESLEVIESLSRQNAALMTLTAEIRQVAKRINLLSLNAAIEATRAGDAGQGFSVVADEVRALAVQSADTGDRIESLVSDINGQMEFVVQQARDNLASTRHARQSNRHTIDRTIGSINERFDSIAEDAEALMRLRDDMSHEIAGVIIQLQFQDELSQVLTHVESALSEVERVFDTEASSDGLRFLEGARDLLENIKRRASTDLERRVLAGDRSPHGSPLTEHNEVEFL